MTEKKSTEATPAELNEEQLDEVQGAGVAMPDATSTQTDAKKGVVLHDVRKQGGEQQEY